MLCHLADDAKKEADWVVSQIMALQERGIDYSDMTVLYRAHYISRILEETLMKKRFPMSYIVVSLSLDAAKSKMPCRIFA